MQKMAYYHDPQITALAHGKKRANQIRHNIQVLKHYSEELNQYSRTSAKLLKKF